MQILFFLTHLWDKEIQERYEKIQVPGGTEKRVLLDGVTFNSAFLGKKYQFDHLIPGNNHWPALDAFLHLGSGYSHYWVVEYDVIYTGDWKDILTLRSDADFLSSHFRQPSDQPKWWWWQTLETPTPLKDAEKWGSTNVLYRISSQGARRLQESKKHGWEGHHEALIPTYLKAGNLKLEELGGNGRLTPSSRKGQFYRGNWEEGTFRTNVRLIKDQATEPNTLFHSVKAKGEG